MLSVWQRRHSGPRSDGCLHENLIPDYDAKLRAGSEMERHHRRKYRNAWTLPFRSLTMSSARWRNGSRRATTHTWLSMPRTQTKVWMEDFKPYPEYELFWFRTWCQTAVGRLSRQNTALLPTERLHSRQAAAFVNIYDPDQRWFVTNTTGEFVVELPGGEVVKDYTVFLSNPYCGRQQGACQHCLRRRICASIKYALYKGAKEADDALAAEVAASWNPCAAGELLVECPENGMDTLVVVSSDAEGAVQSFKSTELYGVYDNDSEWKSLGMTTYHEAIIAEHYDYPETDLEVEIQENTATPGFYRIVNPYAAYEYNFMERTDDHNHYIYMYMPRIRKAVWIENSPVGADFGYGDGRVTSDIAKSS